MWKSEERKKEVTAPITLRPLDEQSLIDLRRRYDETSDAETLPVLDLLEADLWDPLPADVPELLALLPRADLSLQDEVQFAFHPTLTRVWCRKGRRGQRLVEAPGENRKVYGFGLLDWRDGCFDGRVAPGRTADV